jgi:hypothetical protein
MATYLNVLAISLLVARTTIAGFTDFEDLTDGTIYGVGNTIESNALFFEPVSSTVRVKGPSPFGDDAGGSGLELRIGGSTSQLSFTLPNGTTEVSFLFGAYDPNAAFVVNGVSAALAGNFAALNGSVVGGVAVSVIPSPTPPFGLQNVQGQLLLRGQITSLVLSGPELSIDNVSVSVPEPFSALLAGSAAVFYMSLYLPRRRGERKMGFDFFVAKSLNEQSSTSGKEQGKGVSHQI